MARIKNPKLLEFYHTMPCLVCRKMEGIVAHHIKTRGAGGSDVIENLMSLCVNHHIGDEGIHRMGLTSFVEKYNLYKWMTDYGWQKCELTQRWFRDEN